jgi:beta-glucosidase-like glycosyl hydrolase
VVSCLSVAASATTPTPSFHGCLDNVSMALPYCDTRLSFDARAADLVSRLTIDEKVNTLAGQDAPNYCGAHAAAVPRVGLPAWRWLTEANTDVLGCVAGTSRCSTVFVGPEGIAASFNRTSWGLKGDVVSTELRVHNNAGDTDALSGFGPNINTVKDPRYGRNSELPGECPFLAGTYAVAYVRGMQQVSKTTGFVKMLAYLKHYTAYNKEAGRFSWGANVTDFAFGDSYLPQYKMGFVEGGASGAMCSYFAANGVPSCGSDWLMNQLVRTQWGRPDAVFMSDCSAVANFLKNGFATNDTSTSAKALNAGLDVYGPVYS